MTMSINQSLAHGLETLLLFDASTPLLTVAEISKKLRFTQSKTYRLVRTLVQYGLLQENGGTALYSLGLNALRMGLLARQNINLSAIARPFMEELSHLTKETVFLTAVNGTKAICLERVESDEPIRFSFFQPGADLPLHCRAMCKILMAYLPEEDWDKVIAKEGLRRYTPNTITRVDELKAHLRQIRKKGFAFSDQEADRDVRAVAAPVLSRWGELLAGLSIAGPSYRIKKKTVSRLAKLVIDCAKKISINLG
jgi:IclR family transcriptional regulator, KDG regulon repressor